MCSSWCSISLLSPFFSRLSFLSLSGLPLAVFFFSLSTANLLDKIPPFYSTLRTGHVAVSVLVLLAFPSSSFQFLHSFHRPAFIVGHHFWVRFPLPVSLSPLLSPLHFSSSVFSSRHACIDVDDTAPRHTWAPIATPSWTSKRRKQPTSLRHSPMCARIRTQLPRHTGSQTLSSASHLLPPHSSFTKKNKKTFFFPKLQATSHNAHPSALRHSLLPPTSFALTDHASGVRATTVARLLVHLLSLLSYLLYYYFLSRPGSGSSSPYS